MTIEDFAKSLQAEGCRRCNLGFQPSINGVCVSRGSSEAHRMIIGEAPGKDEDSTRQPFTGPAGRLLDRIWSSVGMDTNDWYLTNVVLCRPVAPRGSGKQNLTPKDEQIHRCRPHLLEQIKLHNPSIIVTLGKVATNAVLETTQGITSMCGRVYHKEIHDRSILIYPMLHPAALLHAQKNPEQLQRYVVMMKSNIKHLKVVLGEYNV